MKRNICFGAALAAIMTLLMVAGCGGGSTSTTVTTTTTQPTPPPAQPNALILAGLNEGAEIGVHQALIALGKSNPAAATETSKALAASINNDLLPYLAGGQLRTADEIHQLLASSLFSGKLSPTIQNALAAAASVLQEVLPAPNSTAFLTPVEIAYINAFLTGAAQGCADYGSKAILKPQSARWVPYKTE